MYDLERPLHRLIHHFVKRIFHGAGEGDDLQFGIPALLGILSTPSAFGSIALLGKYSSLKLFLLGLPWFDVYRASIPDEYFFIVYSMVVTGAVVVLRWDRLFPDRQDYDNLAVLPISTRQIFLASLSAMLFLAALFAVDINIASCVILPYVITSRYNTVAAYVEYFVAHTSALLLSSLFVCFASHLRGPPAGHAPTSGPGLVRSGKGRRIRDSDSRTLPRDVSSCGEHSTIAGRSRYDAGTNGSGLRYPTADVGESGIRRSESDAVGIN